MKKVNLEKEKLYQDIIKEKDEKYNNLMHLRIANEEIAKLQKKYDDDIALLNKKIDSQNQKIKELLDSINVIKTQLLKVESEQFRSKFMYDYIYVPLQL